MLFNISSEFKNTKFENCISLGWFCGTAGAMEKMGLRSQAGPFDWCISGLEPVLRCIESDFIDFMKPENLVLSKEDDKIFTDSKYGIRCNHDVKDNFISEVEMICEKYHRRARHFLEAAKKTTCFFRTVKSESEIAYIRENEEYIYRIIKHNNSKSQICFVVLSEMSDLPDTFTWFRLSFNKYIGKILEMRNLFMGNLALQKLCSELLERKVLDKNLLFNKSHNYLKIQSSLWNYCIKNNNAEIAKQIAEYLHIDTNDIFYIWGGGAEESLLLSTC